MNTKRMRERKRGRGRGKSESEKKTGRASRAGSFDQEPGVLFSSFPAAACSSGLRSFIRLACSALLFADGSL